MTNNKRLEYKDWELVYNKHKESYSKTILDPASRNIKTVRVVNEFTVTTDEDIRYLDVYKINNSKYEEYSEIIIPAGVKLVVEPYKNFYGSFFVTKYNGRTCYLKYNSTCNLEIHMKKVLIEKDRNGRPVKVILEEI